MVMLSEEIAAVRDPALEDLIVILFATAWTSSENQTVTFLVLYAVTAAPVGLTITAVGAVVSVSIPRQVKEVVVDASGFPAKSVITPEGTDTVKAPPFFSTAGSAIFVPFVTSFIEAASAVALSVPTA
jgi:hypothetical protein